MKKFIYILFITTIIISSCNIVENYNKPKTTLFLNYKVFDINKSINSSLWYLIVANRVDEWRQLTDDEKKFNFENIYFSGYRIKQINDSIFLDPSNKETPEIRIFTNNESLYNKEWKIFINDKQFTFRHIGAKIINISDKEINLTVLYNIDNQNITLTTEGSGTAIYKQNFIHNDEYNPVIPLQDSVINFKIVDPLGVKFSIDVKCFINNDDNYTNLRGNNNIFNSGSYTFKNEADQPEAKVTFIDNGKYSINYRGVTDIFY